MADRYSQLTRKEKINLLKLESSSLFYKDLTKYSDSDLEMMLFAVHESKKLELKSVLRKWLSKYVIELSLNERVIKDDYIPILVSFQRHSKDISSIENFDSIADVGQMLEMKYGGSVIVKEKDFGVFLEFGNWFIAMPHTEEASIALGRETVWCSAYTVSRNMFKDYVSKDNTILFYLINMKGNTKRNADDKLCVCFRSGEPDFTNDGRTVNSANKWLTKDRFISIFGEELADKLLVEMKRESNKYKNKHPVQEKAERLATNIDEFKKEVSRTNFEDALKLARNSSVCSKKVISYIIDYRMTNFDSKYNFNTLLEDGLLEWDSALMCAGDLLFDVIMDQYNDSKELGDEYTTAMEKIKLNQKNQDILFGMMKNHKNFKSIWSTQLFLINPNISKITISTVLKCLEDGTCKDFFASMLAGNPALDKALYLYLYKNYSDKTVEYALAKNENISIKLFNILSSSKDEDTLEALAWNYSLPASVFTRLATSTYSSVRAKLARKEDIPKELFPILLRDKDEDVIFELLTNPTLPEEWQIHEYNSQKRLKYLFRNWNLSKIITDAIFASSDIEKIKLFAKYCRNIPVHKDSFLSFNNIEISKSLFLNEDTEGPLVIEILKNHKNNLIDLLSAIIAHNGIMPKIVVDFVFDEGKEEEKLFLIEKDKVSKSKLEILMKDKGIVGEYARISYMSKIK